MDTEMPTKMCMHRHKGFFQYLVLSSIVLYLEKNLKNVNNNHN